MDSTPAANQHPPSRHTPTTCNDRTPGRIPGTHRSRTTLQHTHLYIVPEKATDEIMVFDDSSKANNTIGLWYTGTHYDYLQPNDGIPEAFLQQQGKPKQGLRGGGGSKHTQQTVWTSKATTEQHTVFTSTQPTTAPAHSDIEDLDVDDFLPPPPQPQHTPETTPRQNAMRKRVLRTTRGANNSSFHANGSIAWKCPLCPFKTSQTIAEAPTRQQRETMLKVAYNLKSKHLTALSISSQDGDGVYIYI